jgi:hypothetical protein
MADMITSESTAEAPSPAPGRVDQGAPLETRKQWFQSSQDATENARRLSEQDRDYYDHKQWSSEELRKLRARNQPPIVINRIQRKVDTIVGIQERSQTDPKAQPRTPNDEDAAEISTDSLRFVCDQNRFPQIKRGVLENLSIEGLGGAEVTVERRGKLIEVVIKKLRWENIFVDQYSREKDCSDARHHGTAIWMHIDDVGAMYGPEAKKIAEGANSSTALVSGSFEDRPQKFVGWVDKRGNRVVVVDMYYKWAGNWRRAVFCSGGDLIPDGPSPYVDEDGKPCPCMELASLYVNRENERYGMVRGMIGPQDEINYRRSKWLHIISNRQTYANKKAGLKTDQVKYEMGRADGHIEPQAGEFGVDFGIIPTTDMAAGQVELLQHAQNEIDLLGPNNSLQGRGSDEQSGKAWLAQQQAGMAELAMLYSTFDEWCLRIYKQIWNRVRQFWDAPRYVRVADNENAYRYIFVNEPVVDPVSGQPVYETDPLGRPVVDEQGKPVPKMTNRPAEMDVDIIIESSPDYINSQQETLQMLMKMREMGDPIPLDVMFQFVNMPNKRQVMDLLKQGQPQPDPLKVEQLKQGQEKLRQSGAKTEADVRKTNAEATLKEIEGAAAMQDPMALLPQPPQSQLMN